MHAAVVAAALAVAPSPYEILHAEHLIRFPELDAGPPVPPLRTRLAARAAAVRLGLIGPYEFVHWCEPEEYDWGLLTGFPRLRALYADLADCPPLWEADRLPSSQWCDRVVADNRALAANLRGRIAWEPDRAAILEAVAAEADAHAGFWSLASDATWSGADVARRRTSLRAIRDMVGAEAFERGEWPDAAPFGRFTPR